MSDDLLPALERLGAEIERVALEAETMGPRRLRGPRRAAPLSRRAIILAVVSLVVVAAAAVAASTGLLTGEPLKNPAGVGFSPARRAGVPVAPSVRLLSLRAADPDGGPSWGLRTLKTTRGLGCVQLGRVYGSRLGVLGQDGAFADDGKFHERPPDVVGPFDCQVVDAVGHTFIAGVLHGMPASGLMEGCAGQASGAATACPTDDLRIVFYGLLGPRATAVTYRDETNRVRVVPTTGPEGAYLIVMRPSATHPAGSSFGAVASPATGLRSVRYRRAPECMIVSARRLGGAKYCPLVGFRHRSTVAVTTAQVVSPVRLHVSRQVKAQRYPAKLHLPKRHVRRATIVFRARVAAHGVDAGYMALFILHKWKSCHAAYGTTASTDRDIAAGAIVRLHVDVPAACRGAITGTVSYHQAGSEPKNGPPGMFFPGTGPQVGTFSSRLRG